MMRYRFSTVLFRQTLNDLQLVADRLLHRNRSLDARIDLVKCIQHELTYFGIAGDLLSCSKSAMCSNTMRVAYRLTCIGSYPSWTDGQCLNTLLGQFHTKLGGDDSHASFGDRVPEHGGDASNTSKLKVSTRTGDEDDLSLFAVADEIQKAVDDVDVAEEVRLDLCVVSFCRCRLAKQSYIRIDLVL